MEKSDPEAQEPTSVTCTASSPLQKIAAAIGQIISKEAIDTSTKKSLQDILVFILVVNRKEDQSAAKIEATAEESYIRNCIRKDLTEMWYNINEHLNSIQDTVNETLTSSSKLLADMESIAAATRDLTGKVGKITDTAEKIATDTSKYRDAVLTRPVQTIRANTDPKILGDLDRKGRQILIEHLGLDGNNALGKSVAELTTKANEAINGIVDSGKPKDIKVQTLFKTRHESLVLTLNSKEAVTWIKQPEIEIAFTEAFVEGSQITERSYSLIVPNVPISFDPKDDKHLCEVEEVNGLKTKEIVKAKWIKPIGRRRPDQTHAYMIILLSTADSANLIIRDGMNICNARVRPTKQKAEPVQCMKCRKWGHFASNCQADKDTCRDSHCTNTCANKGNVYCVSCHDKSHASWDRACPEFNQRCAIQDERNPENAMPFYPTEHDWTLTARLHRIPLDKCFPGRYAVNSLPIMGQQWTGKGSCPPQRTNGGNSSQRVKANPNTIPIPIRNGNKEVGEPLGVDDQQDTEPSGPKYDWTNQDEEEYLQSKNQVC